MKALICGISGQDGAYLARLMLEKGYEAREASKARTVPGGTSSYKMPQVVTAMLEAESMRVASK